MSHSISPPHSTTMSCNASPFPPIEQTLQAMSCVACNRSIPLNHFFLQENDLVKRNQSSSSNRLVMRRPSSSLVAAGYVMCMSFDRNDPLNCRVA
eukprot:1158481-Pelagomonas_calceolata.AAC.3